MTPSDFISLYEDTVDLWKAYGVHLSARDVDNLKELIEQFLNDLRGLPK